MADETLANGAPTNLDDNPPPETAVAPSKSDDAEKSRLTRENEESKQKIEQLLAEIEALKADGVEAKAKFEERLEEKEREIASSEDDMRALHSISSRAADLETELSRLQHDLISVETENADLSKEVAALKEELEKKAELVGVLKVEKEQKERENVLLQEKVKKAEANVEELRQTSLNGVGVGVVERGCAVDGFKGLKLQGKTLAAAGTVAVVTAAAVAVYVGHSRRS